MSPMLKQSNDLGLFFCSIHKIRTIKSCIFHKTTIFLELIPKHSSAPDIKIRLLKTQS